MKVLLHHKTKDLDVAHPLAWNEKALTQDLELGTLFQAMGGGDELLQKVARVVLLTGLNNDAETIAYRQAILRDCLAQRELIRELYGIAVDAIEAKKNQWFYLSSRYPASILSSAVGMMEVFLAYMGELRKFAEAHGQTFESAGFRRLLDSLKTELAQDYLTDVAGHLEELRFRWGTLITARIGRGNKGEGYTLRRLEDKKLSWWLQLFASKPKDLYTFALHPRDESGARALSELKDDGISAAASIMAGVAEHVLAFFQQLRVELAFYLGCLNLEGRLIGLQEGICFPMVEEMGRRRHSVKGLYDACLVLNMGRKVVANDFDDEGRGLAIITGANQGGKSTFLRSIGLAQLMMQAGMFVPAERFSAGLCHSLFTHFKREEDAGMKSGKFDEEMGRMSEITDHVTPDGIGLFNESFAATNEREGSEIARQIVMALREKGIRVFFVTHLYAFAQSFWEHDRDVAVFLRAERRADTQRTFKVVTGEPLPTSFALDIFQRLFPDDTLTGAPKT
jgi:DNA mismatch repair ATPase MutS